MLTRKAFTKHGWKKRDHWRLAKKTQQDRFPSDLRKRNIRRQRNRYHWEGHDRYFSRKGKASHRLRTPRREPRKVGLSPLRSTAEENNTDSSSTHRLLGGKPPLLKISYLISRRIDKTSRKGGGRKDGGLDPRRDVLPGFGHSSGRILKRRLHSMVQRMPLV